METCFGPKATVGPRANCPESRFVQLKVDLCSDSTESGSNLLKRSVTDGFFRRCEIALETGIGP